MNPETNYYNGDAKENQHAIISWDIIQQTFLTLTLTVGTACITLFLKSYTLFSWKNLKEKLKMPLKKKATNGDVMDVSDNSDSESSESNNEEEFDEHNEVYKCL